MQTYKGRLHVSKAFLFLCVLFVCFVCLLVKSLSRIQDSVYFIGTNALWVGGRGKRGKGEQSKKRGKR